MLIAAVPARLHSAGTAPAATAALARLVLPLTRVWREAAASTRTQLVPCALSDAGHQRRHSACACYCAATLGRLPHDCLQHRCSHPFEKPVRPLDQAHHS
jgi:hypothetical protein